MFIDDSLTYQAKVQLVPYPTGFRATLPGSNTDMERGPESSCEEGVTANALTPPRMRFRAISARAEGERKQAGRLTICLISSTI